MKEKQEVVVIKLEGQPQGKRGLCCKVLKMSEPIPFLADNLCCFK